MFFDFIHRFVRPSAAKKPSRKAAKVNHRKLCFETLESRELLAVSGAEFATIRSQYADLNLSANMADYNVIEITAAELSVAKLKSTIAEAGTSAKDDLIVCRTTATQNKITYASSADEISINISAASHGSVTIVSLGTLPLTIDAAQKTRGLYITASTVALAGLTITGGSTPDSGGGISSGTDTTMLTVANSTISGNAAGGSGGGIYCAGAITVTNSTINNNTAYANGGGIRSSTKGLTITNSTISNNIAGYGYTGATRGGGIDGVGAITVTDSTISGNTSSYDGGGITSSSGPLTVTNSTINNNTSYEGGGIFHSSNSVFTVTNSIISGNTATRGGGIYNGMRYRFNVLSITNSVISGNTASDSSGGGICTSYGICMVTNSVISGNTAATNGGAIANYYSELTVTNSTISGNRSNNGTGGINSLYSEYITYGYNYKNTVSIYNSIVAGNRGGGWGSEDDISQDYKFTIEGFNNLTNFTDWYGGTSGNNIVYNSNLPLFVNAANGDYRIRSGSQAHNAGSNALAAEAGLTAASKDVGGNARIIENIIDIGAYEYGTVVATKLGSPTLGNVLATSSSAISVSWTAVTNATGYTIQYSTSATFASGNLTQTVSSGTTISASIPGLLANTTYYVRILAKGNGTTYTDSDYSTSKNVTTTATVVNLAIPVLGTVTAKSPTQIGVDWTAVSNASGYTVQYSVNSDFTAAKTVDVANGTTIGTQITSLIANTTYYVRILAKGNGVNYISSSYSASKNAKTFAANVVMTPENLRSTSTSKTAIQIEWNKVTDASQYVLQRKGPGDSDFVTIYTGADAKFSDTNRAVDTTYQYQVQATNGTGGTSSFTTAVSVKTLAAAAADVPMVTGAVFTADQKSATVTWNNLGASYRYQIYRNGVLLTPTAISANSLLDTNPAAANRYIIVGYDVNAPVRNQSMPFVLTSNTIVPEIANHTVANGKITLNWDLNGISNVQAVRVYRNGILLLNTASATSVTDTNPTLSPRGNYEYILYVVYQEAGKSITTFSSTYAIPQSGMTSSASSLSLLDSVWSDFDFIEELSLV